MNEKTPGTAIDDNPPGGYQTPLARVLQREIFAVGQGELI
jgi:hypothetical protein